MRRLTIICTLCLSTTTVLALALDVATVSAAVVPGSAAAQVSGQVLLGSQAIATSPDGGQSASEAFGYTAAATGSPASITVYLDSTNGVRLGLYADHAGQPGVRLTSGRVTANAAGWVTVPVWGGASVISGTRYWIAIAASPGNAIGYRDTGTSGSDLDYSGSGIASPYVITGHWNSNPASVYVRGATTGPPVAPANTVAPGLSGTAQQGHALTTSTGTWSGTAPTTYSYQWQKNGTTTIPGATSPTYTASAGDIGNRLDAVVTATNAGGSASATSATSPVVTPPTAPSAPSNVVLPAITGTTTVGQTLQASGGTWTGSPTSLAYGWQDCAAGGSCTPIPGATSSSFTLRAGDVGDTIEVVLTAVNSSGATSASSHPTGVITNTSSGLPSGVTLAAIDGGANYYCAHGFTNACADGWDSPTFFPIGPWYGYVSSPSDVTAWKALGLNTAFRTTANSNLPLMKASGLYAIVDDEGGPETPGMGSETVGLLASDEPPTMSAFTDSLTNTPNAQQDGRFWYLNNTWNFIQYGGLNPISSSAQVLNTLVTTPDGSKRHVDTQSVDTYWFAGARAGSSTNLTYQGGLIYGLGGDMSTAQAECGCRYGDMVDTIRGYQPTYPAPIAQFVENGGPYTQDTSASSYITPPEMNWSVWSSIIHGARQIIYFNNTFGGPGDSGNDIANAYYATPQNGQAVSIDAQTTATDALIRQLAPEINSPQMVGYVTASPADQTFSGIETRATDDNGVYTIFAATRDAETATNIPATFTLAGGYSGPVTVVGENRTVQATSGVFTDTFAGGSTVHIYQTP